jgi:hypothetical protein
MSGTGIQAQAVPDLRGEWLYSGLGGSFCIRFGPGSEAHWDFSPPPGHHVSHPLAADWRCFSETGTLPWQLTCYEHFPLAGVEMEFKTYWEPASQDELRFWSEVSGDVIGGAEHPLTVRRIGGLEVFGR